MHINRRISLENNKNNAKDKHISQTNTDACNLNEGCMIKALYLGKECIFRS